MNWKTRVLKRAVDVAGASAGLVLTAPLFPVVAIAVKLTSKGPVFYSQVRCGADRRSGIAPTRPPHRERRRARGFRTFRMYKFRTMTVDAEKHTGAIIAQKNDSRLTPIGGLLRKTRLDELPQLVHVLKGDMSLVGPRPERPELLARIEANHPFFLERMRLIKPGLTGLAQIKLNYDGTFSNHPDAQALRNVLKNFEVPGMDADQTLAFGNKLLFDLAYSAILENTVEALRTDAEILVQTPVTMILGKGR